MDKFKICGEKGTGSRKYWSFYLSPRMNWWMDILCEKHVCDKEQVSADGKRFSNSCDLVPLEWETECDRVENGPNSQKYCYLWVSDWIWLRKSFCDKNMFVNLNCVWSKQNFCLAVVDLYCVNEPLLNKSWQRLSQMARIWTKVTEGCTVWGNSSV